MLSKSCDPLELTFDPMIESVIAGFRAELALVNEVGEIMAHHPVEEPKEEMLDGVTILARCLGRMFRV